VKVIGNKLSAVNKIKINDRDYKREESIRVFEYDEIEEDFVELIIDENVPLHSLLGSDFILLFISPAHKRAYHWIGKNTTPKKRFGAADKVGKVRDREARGYLIRTEDQGEESIGFKVTVGLIEQEEDEKHEEAKPIYDGTQDEELTSEEILRLLEKMPVPEGYEREFVMINNEIFRYKEYPTPSYNADILKKKLFPLKEEIDDGTYTFEDCLPRILFSYNKIKVIELLKKKEKK
jgi:hypothetical protein